MSIIKTPDIKAFVGSGFDCEFWDEDISESVYDGLTGFTAIAKRPTARGFMYFDYCKPRQDRDQVLPSWEWVPDGFMWSATWVNRIADEKYTETVNSERLREIADHDLHFFISAACIGLEQGYELEGMEVCGVSA